MRVRSLRTVIIIITLIAFVIIATLFLYRRPQEGVKETVTGLGSPIQPALTPKPEFVTPRASPAGKPVLEKLELVTDQAFAVDGKYVPNSWGVQKNRIVRTSGGDLFTVYISAGSSDKLNREWHLMHEAPGGSWEEIKTGNAGSEPINIIRGPHDEIHLFAWPGTLGKLQHLVSNDTGKTFKSEFLPGNWKDDQEQGYSGSGINEKGDIVFFQTGDDKPGIFNWTYYSPQTNKWTFHKNLIDYRYTYAFFLPGNDNSLTMVAMRDVKRRELGYPPTSSSQSFDYIFDAIKYFHIDDATQKNPGLEQQTVIQVPPENQDDYDMAYLTDTYIDTAGRVHILYNNLYDGPHHIIIQNGQKIKDTKIPTISNQSGQKMRIVQDTQGHFYIISIDDNGNLIVDPGTASDTDGTQLEPGLLLNTSQYPGCNSDDDYCHSPTFTVPRNGHTLSDTIDGTYGNRGKEIYFRIKLR